MLHHDKMIQTNEKISHGFNIRPRPCCEVFFLIFAVKVLGGSFRRHKRVF